MKLFDVKVRKEFGVEGKLKRLWHRVGIVRLSQNGNAFLHLFHQPNVDYYLFEPGTKNMPTIELGGAGREEEIMD